MNRWLKLSDSERVERDADGVPTAFQLLRSGTTKITKNGKALDLVLTSEDLSRIERYQQGKGSLVPVDAEHFLADLADQEGMDEDELLKYKPKLGERTAHGFTSLQLREDGTLWANVERWSDRSRQLLSGSGLEIAGYFSPTIRGLRSGRLRVTSIALTNTPAINNLERLSASGEAVFECDSLYLSDDDPKQDSLKMDSSTALGRAINGWLGEQEDEAAAVGRLASAAGIDDGTMRQIISGDIKSPGKDAGAQRERLGGIARVMGRSVDSLAALIPEDMRKLSAETETTIMKPEILGAIATMIGLEADSQKLSDGSTSDEQFLTQLRDELEAAFGQMGQSLKLSDDTPPTLPVLLAAVEGAAAASAKLGSTEERLRVLEGQEKTRYIDGLADVGKLTDAQLPWAGTQSMKQLKAYAATAPVVVPTGPAQSGAGGLVPDTIELTADEYAYVQEEGLDAEEFLASKRQLAAQSAD